MTQSNQLTELPLSSLVPRLRSGELNPQALQDAVEARYHHCGEALNAYKLWAPEPARQQAQAAAAALAVGANLGPLSGIPVSVKDHFGVHGLPIFAGTARELPEKFRHEGPVIATLRRQLALFTGKTHSVELAFGGIGSNPHWGTPRNPWDANSHRVSGGSSSGAGVSLQTGTAWLALGTDTGGSVRIPASMTGSAGLKTSAGRWSLKGIVPLSSTLDTAGILARSVADLAYGFAAIDPAWDSAEALLGHTQMSPAALRIGIADRSMWEHCQDDVSAVVHKALKELATAGANLSELTLPEAVKAVELLRSGSVVSAECDAFIDAELPAWRQLIDPTVTMRISDGGNIPAREYVLRQQQITALAASAEQRLDEAGVDVIAAPTVPITPPTLAEVSDIGDYRRLNGASLSNTCVGNFLHLCGLSIPVGLDQKGLPVGLMLLARNGQEERLLAAGLAVERVLGNARQRLGRPPLCPL